MAEMWRLFVAIELPEAVQAELQGVEQRLQHHTLPVAWTRPETMHLTLWFLGATPVEQVEAVGAALRGALAGNGPCDVALGGFGAFPNMRQPSVIWVGVGGDVAALQRMHQRITTAVEPLGFQREARPFHPHLTLGRTRRDANPAQQAALAKALEAIAPPQPLEWRATQVVLFRSERQPGGVRHMTYKTFPL